MFESKTFVEKFPHKNSRKLNMINFAKWGKLTCLKTQQKYKLVQFEESKALPREDSLFISLFSECLIYVDVFTRHVSHEPLSPSSECQANVSCMSG